MFCSGIRLSATKSQGRSPGFVAKVFIDIPKGHYCCVVGEQLQLYRQVGAAAISISNRRAVGF